jgi:hypothetical protein
MVCVSALVSMHPTRLVRHTGSMAPDGHQVDRAGLNVTRMPRVGKVSSALRTAAGRV